MTRIITALAPWTFTSPGGTVIFNERTVEDPWPDDLPEDSLPAFLWLQSAKGLRAIPDLDDNREDKTEAPHEERYKEYGRGKTLSCTAQIYGRNFVEAHQGVDAVLSVVSPDLTNGDVIPIFVVIAPEFAGATDESIFGCTCRAFEATENLVVPSAAQQPSSYFFDLAFDLRLDDPRFYAWTPIAEGDPGAPGTTGDPKW